MKTFFLSIFSLLSVAMFSEALPADYYITSSKEDKLLKKTEAVFMFTFFNSKNQLIKETITFSYNGIEKKQKPNDKGEISLKIKPGKYVFNFLLNLNHYEITTDS